MGDLLQGSDGAIRLADALIRNGGGRTVLLRLAIPAVPGDEGEQLGLATPGFQANSVARLLVSASAVQAVVGSLGFDSADVLFETAVGVLIDELLYKITNSFSSQAMGMPYCYWLMLEAPVR
jgi:hypothetical protein